MVESEAAGAVRRRDARRGDVRPPRDAEGRSTRSTSWSPKPAPSRRTWAAPAKNDALIGALKEAIGDRLGAGLPGARQAASAATRSRRSRRTCSQSLAGRRPKPTAGTPAELSQGIRRARIPDHARLGARHQGPHRRPRARHRAPDHRRRSASCRAPTARRCSPAARPRRSSSVTLGTARDGQIIDAVAGEYKEHFLFHYNFPPYSVGEAGRMMGPKRREIGHGRLAKRGVLAVMPTMEEFPYTIRVVSEITESNGSSSMASVCGSSLALMDAGVPIKAPVAGIAMGLVKEGDDFVVLSDILGDEDHLGDMDFKVAGTAERHLRAADGHQDPGHHRRDHEGRAGAGQGRAACTSSARWPTPSPRRARELSRVRAAPAHDQDPPGQDPRSDRQGRFDDPGDHQGNRHADRHPGRRHDRHRVGQRRRRARPRRRASSRSPPTSSRAASTKARSPS